MDAAHRGISPPSTAETPVQAKDAGRAKRPATNRVKELASDAMDTVSDAFDYVSEQASDIANDVAAWSSEQVDNLQDLLTYIDVIGDEAAKLIIDQVIEHKVEIALLFLTNSPSHALVAYIIPRLPLEALRLWLESIGRETLETVFQTAIALGAVAAVAGAIFALGTSSFPYIKSFTPALLSVLWEHVPDELRQLIKQTLVEYWPVGLGFVLEGGLGATFGYPIHLGVDAYFELAHFREGQFKLRRGGVLQEAFDTGLGAGVYFAIDGKGSNGKGDIGIGAEMGIQAQTGLKQIVHQEFDFPVLQDNAFVAFLLGVACNNAGSSKFVLDLLSKELRNVLPEAYNTKTKFELKAFGEGNAAAKAGLRTGSENTRKGASTWTNHEGAADTGKSKWWQRWMNAGVFGRIALDAGVSIESENREWTKDADGVRIPAKIKVEAAGEASAAMALVHALPVISQALPAGINFDGGTGIKVAWMLTGGNDDNEPQISEPTFSLFGKTGNMDRYEGAASETSIALGQLNGETFSSLDSFLQNISTGAEIKRRFSIGQTIGRKYFMAAEKAGAFNVMLPADYRNYGFRVEGYIDLESHLSADQVRSIFRSIANVVTGYQQGGAPLQQLYQDVVTLIATGKGPPHVISELEAVANSALSGLKRLHLHGLAGLSVAGGAQLSGGAKLRLRAGLGGQATIDYDLMEYVQDICTVSDIEALLRNLDIGGPHTLHVESEQQLVTGQ